MKIAISGLSGVGSSSTARFVSEELGLPMTNFTFRDMAKERGVAFEDLQKQAEDDFSIDMELDKRLIIFIQANDSCLAATDLACWLDDPKIYKKVGLDRGADYSYKIWLEAPLLVRAARMHEREGGDLKDVIEYNHQRDLDNRERYLRLYGVDIFDHTSVDWVLETSHMNLEEVVTAICKRVENL